MLKTIMLIHIFVESDDFKIKSLEFVRFFDN